MMKAKIWAVATVIAIFMASCGESEQSREQREKIDALENDKVQMQLDYEDLQAYLSVIADGLDSIRIEEQELLINNTGEGNGWNRQRMKQNLTHVRQTLNRHRERIAELEAKLADGNGNMQKLRTIVASLRQQLDAKDRELAQLRADLDDNRKSISSLTRQVEQLSEEQTEMNRTIVNQQETIDEQARNLSTAYVKIGTKKDLDNAGLLKKKNIFSKKKLDLDAIDLSTFQTVDTRSFSTLNLPKKVKILTDMPSDSYTLTASPDGNGKVLTVTNPQRFWSLSKALIIQID